MLQHYQQSLQKAWDKLSEENDEVQFEIAQEGRIRLNMDEVFICSLLGL